MENGERERKRGGRVGGKGREREIGWPMWEEKRETRERGRGGSEDGWSTTLQANSLSNNPGISVNGFHYGKPLIHCLRPNKKEQLHILINEQYVYAPTSVTSRPSAVHIRPLTGDCLIVRSSKQQHYKPFNEWGGRSR